MIGPMDLQKSVLAGYAGRIEELLTGFTVSGAGIDNIPHPETGVLQAALKIELLSKPLYEGGPPQRKFLIIMGQANIIIVTDKSSQGGKDSEVKPDRRENEG